MNRLFRYSRDTLLLLLFMLGLQGTAAAQAPLSTQEITDLTYMREEEKVARDVYTVLNRYWGWQTEVFANIAASEQQHMDTMKKMLDKYGLPDPVVLDVTGAFTNPKLKALYEELVERGKQSLLEGLKVGALIEEVDMVDISTAYDNTTHRDLQNAYTNLQAGSRNHLRAFAGNIVNLTGTPYVAQYLSQESVDEILASDD